VFKLDKTGKFSVMFRFPSGGAKGVAPLGPLARDAAGNLYGTTYMGGRGGGGVVFKINKTGQETVLFNFARFADGIEPFGSLVLDAAGNLYGNTAFGGNSGAACGNGCGVVFKLDTAGKETVLYRFSGGADGFFPRGVIRDPAGNLYGNTTYGGGACDRYGDTCGVVFKLDPAGKEIVLHTFTTGNDGGYPVADLTRDAKGNLYGTTTEGGEIGSPDCNAGCGVVFKIAP
jgi:uncharacterized repeat protein (TIGR03803 family)